MFRFRRRGYTLLEATLSIAVTAILMGGIGTALVLAGRAVPGPNDPLREGISAAEAADQIASELAFAKTLTEATPTTIEFTVERYGADQSIRYQWSGTPGDPLERQYNGGTIAAFVDDVREFVFTYEKSTSASGPPVPVEGPETVLASYDPVTGPQDYAIKEKEWIGQYFVPSLAAEAVSWNVTRVRFQAQVHGGNKGIVAVQLRSPGAGNLPTGAILEEFLMYESALPEAYQWQEFAFSNVKNLAPGSGLCLALVLNFKDAHLCDILYDESAGSGMLTTSDSEAGWAFESAMSMAYYVYGTVTTLTPPPPRDVVGGVGILLRTGGGAAGRVITAARLLNEPQAPSP